MNEIPQPDLTEDQKRICDMLVFKHIPNHEVARKKANWYHGLLEDDTIETFDHQDTRSARNLLAKITAECLEKRGADSVSIGVSSGMDSRLCLGALLDVLPSKKIFVYTYGHPGNRDYENAPYLLQKRVVNHVLINTITAKIEPTAKSPFNIKRTTDRIVFSGVDDLKARVQVVGRLGDALAGAHLGSKGAPDWQQAKADFIHRFSKREIFENGWLPERYNPMSSLPDEPHLPGELVEFDLQLDLLYRQQQLICLKPALIDQFNRGLIGASDEQISRAKREIFCPFLDPRWQKSFLQMPRKVRYRTKFYKRFCKNEFPEIFPDLLNEYEIVNPKGATNIDWRHLWHSDAGFREDIRKLVAHANKNGGWFDFSKISAAMDENDKFAQNLLKRIFAIFEAR